MGTEKGPQHIIALQSENVKKITVVQVKLDEKDPSGTVIITGENGAGKSSVLDSIEMALRGKDYKLDKPIRDGKEKAVVILKTQDYIVTRRFVGENTYLEITNHEGLTYKKPQELLDSLINTIGFDPLEFAEMDQKDQAKQLLEICPTELDLEKNAEDQKALKEQRTFVNRDVKRLAAQIQGYPPAEKDLPITEVSLAALNDEFSKLIELDRRHQVRLENLAAALKSVANIEAQINVLQADHAKLTALIAEGKKKAEEEEAQNYAEKAEAIRAQMKKAESTNAKIREAKIRQTYVEDHNEAVAKSTDFDNKILALTQAREEALKKTKFPVDGLSIDAEGRVIFNGNPLKQCSSAEQIRVGIALAASANPGLRVAFIRHGSLLDAKSMQLVADLAKQHGMQVWIERVQDNSPAAIQICDGSNIGAVDTPETSEPAAETTSEEKPKAKKTKSKPEAKTQEVTADKGTDLFNGDAN